MQITKCINLFYYLYVNYFTALPVDSQQHKAMKGDVLKFQVCDIFTVTLWNRADHYIFVLWFVVLLFFLT